MATGIRSELEYPTSDGKPLAETDWHRVNMTDLIALLEGLFARDAETYVSGNMLLFYEEGNRRKHVSPDVFIVQGVPKHKRPNYLLWQEGKGPDVVVELTSRTTASEDMESKFELYRDVLQVEEYFLFDPHQEYLVPSLQGFRLRNGEYARIRPIQKRLPSEVLRLHFERDDWRLRAYDPVAKTRLQTPAEAEARLQAKLDKAEAEVEKLRQELKRQRKIGRG